MPKVFAIIINRSTDKARVFMPLCFQVFGKFNRNSRYKNVTLIANLLKGRGLYLTEMVTIYLGMLLSNKIVSFECSV